MTIYSHSRLNTFEQCPFKFKLRYLDKVKPEIEPSIESHLGKMVHDTLEWLYTNVKKGKLPSIDDLITHYANTWNEKYTPGMVIVRENLTDKDYFNKGVEFLLNYYQKHKPFDDNTLEVEKRIQINLDPEGRYKIQGFIDRLSHNLKTGEYEIHDYKTGNNIPPKHKIEEDRQLAFYAIGIKDIYGHDKKVCLTWHYLAHDLKICSNRTNQQLGQLKQETIALIKKIETTTNFPTYVSKLCDWCEYKNMCPAWTKQRFKKETQKQIEPSTSYKTSDNLELNKEEVKERDSLDIW